MEDTLKGVLVTATIVALFATSMLSYIVLFPQEQGIGFSTAADSYAYAVVLNNSAYDTEDSLVALNNNSQTAFNQWDITVGFMGSNTIKQTSQTGVSGYVSNIFNQLGDIATLLFKSGSPIVYALGVISILALGYLIYQVIQFVRQGR